MPSFVPYLYAPCKLQDRKGQSIYAHERISTKHFLSDKRVHMISISHVFFEKLNQKLQGMLRRESVTTLIAAVPLLNHPRFDLSHQKDHRYEYEVQNNFYTCSNFEKKHLSTASYFAHFAQDKQRFSVGELVDGSQNPLLPTTNSHKMYKFKQETTFNVQISLDSTCIRRIVLAGTKQVKRSKTRPSRSHPHGQERQGPQEGAARCQYGAARPHLAPYHATDLWDDVLE